MDHSEKTVWPGWKTVRLIGRGSYGAVYEIEREVFGEKEKAALKLITIPQSASDVEELRNDGYSEESITARFQSYLKDIVREYTLMAKMKGCANIVYCDDVKYVQHDDGIGWDIYIKMELLTAMPRALGSGIPEEQAVRVGRDICSALAFCEKRNLLHRDIKPQNIFVAPDGTCKLGDFGIAKTAERTTGGTKTGTYKYNERRTPFLPLPPESPSSGDEDRARARRFAGEAIPAPAHGSEALKRIVLKACAYDPQERYQSAEEMLRDLEKLAGGSADAPAAHVGVDAPLQSAVRPTAPPAGEPLPDEDGTVSAFGRHMSTPADAPLRSAMRPTASPAGEPLPDEDATVTSSVYTPKAKKTAPTAGKTKEFPLWIKIFDVLAVAAILLIVLLPKGGSKANIDPLLNAAIQSNSPTASPAVEIVQIRFDTMELSEFTTYPGEMLTLNAYVSPQTITDKVKWSSDDKDEEYITIIVDPDDGNKIIFECLKYSEKPLKIYAELGGVRAECTVRFKRA